MNDELKEILHYLKIENGHCSSELSYEETRLLLDYITNLQQENQDLSRVCELYGKSLYNAELTDYKSRIEKAVEYIKEDMYSEPNELYGLIDGEHLLNILNGRSDE